MAVLLSGACSDDPAPASDVAESDAPSDALTEVDETTEPDESDPSTDPSDDVEADVSEPEGYTYWPGMGEGPSLDSAFYTENPGAFARISGWTTHVEGRERPDTGHRGAFATGNGKVFGLFGMTDPLNTLHGFVGPTYEKDPRFYADHSVGLALGSGERTLYFDEEWIVSSLSAPVVISRGRVDVDAGSIELDTIDFAPWTEEQDARDCLVRILLIRNAGEETMSGIEVRAEAAVVTSAGEGGAMVHRVGDKRMLTQFIGVDSTFDHDTLSVGLDSIEPEEEVQLTLVHCTQIPEGEVLEPIPEIDSAALLRETVEAYQAWEEDLVQFDLPDPMVSDLLDGLKLTLINQTSQAGASCPMSGYTRTWARDNVGPALGLLALGAHEEVAGMMDYIYGAVLLAGDLRNSYGAALDLSDLPEPPDWDSMDPLSGRVASETPSYMVRIYGRYFLASGDLERARERWGFLRRCALNVGFGEDRLLAYTGDETFRAAMNASFGLELEYPHHEEHYSLNSNLLWLGSAHDFELLGTALGHDEDVAQLGEIRAEMEAAVSEHYLLDDGCLSAFVAQDDLEPWPAPYEDEAFKVTWSGWLEGDEELAQDSIECLLERARREPGRVVSPLDPRYVNHNLLPAGIGVYTGMLPGYTLSSLTAVGHSEARDAFDALGVSASTSGNFQEYYIYDDHSGLSIVYDTSGFVQDYTAKYRPWEGGINAAAVMEYLTGFEPNAPEHSFEIRPHLPEPWPEMTIRNLRIADDRFDLALERVESGVRVRLSSRASQPYDVTLRWDAAPEQGAPEVTLNDDSVAEADLVRFQHFGINSVASEVVTLAAGGELDWTITTP